MTEFVYLDGEFIESDKAFLPVRTHAFLYGTSVFEGLRAYYNSEENQMYAFRVPEHFQRLVNSAKVMWMKSPYSIEEYCNITKELLKKITINKIHIFDQLFINLLKKLVLH